MSIAAVWISLYHLSDRRRVDGDGEMAFGRQKAREGWWGWVVGRIAMLSWIEVFRKV
jgi:hypothetical protein